jgi:hypothetical protein
MRRALATAAALLGASGCASAPPPPVVPRTGARPPPTAPLPPLPARGPIARCEGDYGSATETGRLSDPAIVEASGIAASRLDPSVLWIHNDSGDTARVFAVRTDGSPVAQLVLDGVEAIDFEDIAAAPCLDGTPACLWIADTGDNRHARPEAAIYVTHEPDLRGVRGGVVRSGPVVRLPITWPGRPVDAEAILVSPALDALYLFEKIDARDARVFRYKAPFSPGERRMMEPIATMESPGLGLVRYGRMITGASMHPGGDRFLLRVYTGVYEYRLSPGKTMADVGSIDPLRVTLGPLSEPQGEAVGYDAAGTGLWTVSEDPRHRPGQPLHHYDCKR